MLAGQSYRAPGVRGVGTSLCAHVCMGTEEGGSWLRQPRGRIGGDISDVREGRRTFQSVLTRVYLKALKVIVYI